ncbi:TIGR03790 family protein [candidate division KSB1 bacterium]|nr:TIGR03790 family protein [candidate division KSB1 bacterium]
MNAYYRILIYIFTCFLVFGVTNLSALESAEILVLANTNVPEGVNLAIYYMQKRNIPAGHLIRLQITNDETCQRIDYITKIAIPVRKKLKELEEAGDEIRCLVIMYGLPLRIVVPNHDDKSKASSENKIMNDTAASLDSELMLVRNEENYPIGGWIPNPYFVGFQKDDLKIGKENVLMVARLDAPNSPIVKRLIDTSIAIEKTGLSGTAYFDARWKKPKDKELSGYALYDQSIRLAAEKIRSDKRMPVVFDESDDLFKPNSCPNAALYCGWYSLSKYIDSFGWAPGSVGYHIASGECTTLKNPNSQVWCKMMLEKGIVATLGPVGEPYVQAFPLPEVFFGFLMQGYLTLAECYTVSLPYISWKMVLIGDPLYFPFRKIKNK